MEEKKITKHYSNDDITVIWQPDKCIHSTLCWRGLSDVFNPKQKPWITLSGSDTEHIIKQVEHCPSGALSFVYNEVRGEAENVSSDVETIVETSPNGPLLVYGNITIKDSHGNTEKKNRVTAFCRCGASGNKPYCDGSHIKVGFKTE